MELAADGLDVQVSADLAAGGGTAMRPANQLWRLPLTVLSGSGCNRDR